MEKARPVLLKEIRIYVYLVARITFGINIGDL